MKKTTLATAMTLMAAGMVSGCVANNPAPPAAGTGSPSAGGPLAVTISDDGCDVATAAVPSGRVTFSLVNQGTVKNEFEILADDRLRIVGERENLGPGTTTEYAVVLEPGTYFTACKKNMVGPLVGAKQFTVSDSGRAVEVSQDERQLRDQAVTAYKAYVRDQVGQLTAATAAFVTAYKAGDTAKAKQLYPTARQHYERIEPTAEAFGIKEAGDLDVALDQREVDYQAAGTTSREWSGWHVLEKDLWRPSGYQGLSQAEGVKVADKLSADTKTLYGLVYSDDFTVNLDDISNGAIGLLEEVATSKITGEEEAFSHTDLWDFQANVEGAKVAFGNVEKLAEKKDPELTQQLKTRFAAMQAELDTFKHGEGFVFYDKVSDAQRKTLSNQVNALRRPLAKLTGAILA
ncbi:iron uptake system protein EfeO [Nigerium massiliense]|uniref:iron uptake system protein EfeO n=1 Tax=Nigerium massiliense TaxID=1522317 RepID=UPI000693DCA1|nr:iron uptake system protein EfeO [Nigerium massiliense]